SNVSCVGAQLDTINTYLADNSQLAALNGIGLWARIGWRCEGAGTLPGAVAFARQVLGFLVHVIELGTAPTGCDKLVQRSGEILTVAVGGPIDPNEKSGPLGAVHHAQPLSYTISFENLAAAGSSARTVIVEDHL